MLDGNWHRIVATRSGNTGVLFVDGAVASGRADTTYVSDFFDMFPVSISRRFHVLVCVLCLCVFS